MFATYVLGLLIVSYVFTTEARNVTYCLSNDTDPYLAFATKTSYEYISSLRSSISADGVVGCKPVQVWILFRHGTRFPGLPDIETQKTLLSYRDQVVANHEVRFNGNLCDKDLDNLKAWHYDLDASNIDKLAPQGYSDLLFIAKRMKTQFANVLNTTYSPEKFVFKHTDTERAMKSTSAFAEGLFGKDANIVIPDSSQEEDAKLLRPYSNCSEWEAKSGSFNREKLLFEETEIMKTLVADVSKRLGFRYNLTMELVESIYDMCRFDKAWNYALTSPWCAAFTIEELQLLEYTEDLKYYYKSSYGNDINLKIACPLLKDMYEKFSKTAENVSDSSNPLGTFYFSHASMLNMFNARLGLAQDVSPLTHANYYTMGKRNFKTSYIVPFATNLAAVFYKCTSGEENQVMFYRNEKLISYDGCNVGLCSWKMIKEKFASIVDPTTCNVEFCKGGSGGSTMLTPILSLVFGVVAVLVFRLS